MKVMKSPLVLAEYLQIGFESGVQAAQDASLECLVLLIGKYGLEYENYYENLYNMIRLRPHLELRLLKILEISLRNSKIKSSTIFPYMKMMLRKSLTSTPLEICWFLGIILNLAKRNESLKSFFISKEELEDDFDLVLTFKEVERLPLKAFEIVTLRK